jgi:hypothetical protein
MVVRADETHLRYSLQYPDHLQRPDHYTEIIAVQGFSGASGLGTTQYAAKHSRPAGGFSQKKP